MATLFELSNDLAAIYELVDETGGELTPALETWLAEIENDEAAKLDGYVHLIRTAEMEAAAAKAEAEQWQARTSARTNFAKRLKDRIKQHMEATGRTKVQTAKGRTLAIQANGGKAPLWVTPVLDLDAVPEELIVVRRDLDTEKCRAALEAGEHLGFARLEPRGTHIRIR